MRLTTSYFTLILLTISFISFGQQFQDTHDPNEIKSLLGKGNELNGFGGGDIKIGNINTERALIMGAYGGVLINRHYMLGIAGYGIASNPRFDGSLNDGTPRKLTIHGGYAGLLVGGTILSREIVHLSLPLVLGAGAIQLSDDDFFQNGSNSDFTIENSAFFVAEQAVQLEFNITRSLRLAAGASYRMVRGLELRNLSDKNLSDWTAQISLRFGRF